MNDDDRAGLLEQAAQELGLALEKLERYQEQVRRGHGPINDDIYAELKGEIWQARSRLRRQNQHVPPPDDEIVQLRQRAQEQAIAELAARRGWAWEESAQRWRTPEGNFYTRIGEPLTAGNS